MPSDLLFPDEVYRPVGACLAVHKDRGNGFAEPVYQDALEIELELSEIPFDPQTDEHRAQLSNYLKVTGLQLGLLVNFGSHPQLEWERLILSHS